MQGHIRFEDEESAPKVLDALKEAAGEGGAVKMCGVEVEVRVLEGKGSSLACCTYISVLSNYK